MPWNALDPTIPHQAYNGHPTTFKAIARGGTGSYEVEWDYDGDGTFDHTFTTSNRYNLSAIHTYPDETTTVTHQAVVRVTSGTETATAVYPVRIFADVPSDPTLATERQLQVMRGVAVDDAMWWQHLQMVRSGDEANPLNGAQATGYVPSSYAVASTAGYIWALALNGHFIAFPSESYVGSMPNPAENDLRWKNDPYAEDMMRAVNYLMTQVTVYTGLPAADESNLVGFYPEVSKSPIPGTDDGVGLWFNGTTYINGHALSALAVSRLTDYVAQVGSPQHILGRTYQHVIQQFVDGMVFAQGDSGDGLGSWYYTPNSPYDDLSTALWALTALWHVDEFMSGDGVIVPNHARVRAAQYTVANSRSVTAGEQCGSYRNSTSGCAFTISAGHVLLLGWLGANQWKLGDTGHAFPGHNSLTRGQLRALYDGHTNFIGNNWLKSVNGSIGYNIGVWAQTDGVSDYTRTDRRGNHYAMLHWQDAARAVKPELTTFGEHDWSRQASIFLVNNQHPDGRYQSVADSWINNYSDNYGAAFVTAWSILVLSPDAIPPLAIAEASTTSAEEGEVIDFDGSASDPGTGNPTYTWDFGNGDTMVGQNVSYAFPDNGTYQVKLIAESIGGVSEDVIEVTITNVAPTADAGADRVSNEGASVAFAVAVTDPGSADTHTYAWDFGDGNSSTAAAPSHTYVDDGVYTVTVTVTDDDGDSGSDTLTVTVNNVPPTITSTPGTSAIEGSTYTYALTFTDPGSVDTHTCSLAEAPAGMTIDATSCLVEWTPSFAQSLGASAPVEVCVEDDDGGSDCQSYSITVTFTDEDGDGLPDSWEIANFGDITSQDQFGDPDGDGRNNLQEFLGLTDPNVFDGPDTPTPVSPVCGSDIDELQVTLVVDNAVDPQGDELEYEFELYKDVNLTLLVAAVNHFPEGAGGQTSWSPPLALEENTTYYWRSRARDASAAGPWSQACSFFASAVNDAPTAPRINTPDFNSQVNTFTPTLIVDNATDPDNDPLTYTFEVYAQPQFVTLVASTTGVDEGTNTTSWEVDVSLSEDTWYYWRARATDDQNLSGPWSLTGSFFVTTENAPPEAPTLLSPQNGTVVNTVEPVLTLLNSDDSDFDVLVYDFELATDSTFANVIDSADDVAAQGNNNTSWEPGTALEENGHYCWRARADDGQATSAWSSACFLVSEVNDPPAVPTLMNPSDGSVVRTNSPGYSWATAKDPEGDQVLYAIEVMDAANNVVASATGMSGNSAVLNAELDPGASYTWRVKAIDEHGAESAWTSANTFSVHAEEVKPPDVVVNGSGCSTGGGALGLGALLALLGLALAPRRRRA